MWEWLALQAVPCNGTCLTVSSFEVTVVTGADVTLEKFMAHATITTRVAATLQVIWNSSQYIICNTLHCRCSKGQFLHPFYIHSQQTPHSWLVMGRYGVAIVRILTLFCPIWFMFPTGNIVQFWYIAVLFLQGFRRTNPAARSTEAIPLLRQCCVQCHIESRCICVIFRNIRCPLYQAQVVSQPSRCWLATSSW